MEEDFLLWKFSEFEIGLVRAVTNSFPRERLFSARGSASRRGIVPRASLKAD